MMAAYRAYRALTARDAQCAGWIEFAQDMPAPSGQVAAAPGAHARTDSPHAQGNPLLLAIRRGLKDDAAAAARAMVAAGAEALSVVNDGIVPALEVVGRAFEEGKAFLPQLLMSAEAAGAAFEVVRAAFPAREGSAKGPVVMATVKGDIHDIGKNICRALLENYGYKVIDLGRDVPPERVLEAARREKAPLVGLSALMTTTVGAMAETVALLHRELPGCQVVVGGAVLTAEYAANIEADHYAKDAMGLVRLAESMFSEGGVQK